MQDSRGDMVSGDAPARQTAVSPNNPCPFLRAAVAEGFIGGHVVPVAMLVQTVEAASGKTGLQKSAVGIKTCLVALVANGLSPFRLLRSWWSGAELDALRDGPLDKRGSGSRILGVTAEANETELARLAGFGTDRPDPAGGSERGLTLPDITAYMDANFERAKGHRRRIDRQLMNGEWPVLLDIMGKERRLPDRITARLSSQAPTILT